jgi:hypothetical protein
MSLSSEAFSTTRMTARPSFDASSSSLGELNRRRVRHHLGLGHALERELGFLACPLGVDHDDLAGLDLAERIFSDSWSRSRAGSSSAAA